MQTITNLTDAAASIAYTPIKKSGFFGNLEALKADFQAAGLAGATELISTISVRKPKAMEFIRIHPDENMTITMILHEDRVGFASEYYVILPHMVQEMTELGGAFYAQLYPANTLDGETMIWPVKLPTGGASGKWQETAMDAVAAAKSNWIRLFADVGRGHYRIMKAEGDLKQPDFLDKSLNELLELGFKDRVIDNSDHPICRKLRGRV